MFFSIGIRIVLSGGGQVGIFLFLCQWGGLTKAKGYINYG